MATLGSRLWTPKHEVDDQKIDQEHQQRQDEQDNHLHGVPQSLMLNAEPTPAQHSVLSPQSSVLVSVADDHP